MFKTLRKEQKKNWPGEAKKIKQDKKGHFIINMRFKMKIWQS